MADPGGHYPVEDGVRSPIGYERRAVQEVFFGYMVRVVLSDRIEAGRFALPVFQSPSSRPKVEEVGERIGVQEDVVSPGFPFPVVLHSEEADQIGCEDVVAIGLSEVGYRFFEDLPGRIELQVVEHLVPSAVRLFAVWGGFQRGHAVQIRIPSGNGAEYLFRDRI